MRRIPIYPCHPVPRTCIFPARGFCLCSGTRPNEIPPLILSVELLPRFIYLVQSFPGNAIIRQLSIALFCSSIARNLPPPIRPAHSPNIGAYCTVQVSSLLPTFLIWKYRLLLNIEWTDSVRHQVDNFQTFEAAK